MLNNESERSPFGSVAPPMRYLPYLPLSLLERVTMASKRVQSFIINFILLQYYSIRHL